MARGQTGYWCLDGVLQSSTHGVYRGDVGDSGKNCTDDDRRSCAEPTAIGIGLLFDMCIPHIVVATLHIAAALVRERLHNGPYYGKPQHIVVLR